MTSHVSLQNLLWVIFYDMIVLPSNNLPTGLNSPSVVFMHIQCLMKASYDLNFTY